MSDVKIKYQSGDAGDTATLLLAAAEKKGLDASVVRTGDGTFYAPQDVADEAGVDYEGKSEKSSKSSTTKKTTAKKATAKKTAAKKTAASGTDKE